MKFSKLLGHKIRTRSHAGAVLEVLTCMKKGQYLSFVDLEKNEVLQREILLDAPVQGDFRIHEERSIDIQVDGVWMPLNDFASLTRVSELAGGEHFFYKGVRHMKVVGGGYNAANCMTGGLCWVSDSFVTREGENEVS